MKAPRAPRFASIFGWLLLGAGCADRAGVGLVPEASQRFVATPSALSVVTQSEAYSGLPGEVTFGDPKGRSALYLQFASEWRAHGAPLKAFLALEPRIGEIPDPEPVRVEVWRVRSPWRAETLHAWADKPELAPPYVSTVISSSPSRTLRVDITAFLRFAADNPELDHGLALIAGRGRGHGASFATGMSGGSAPRLEVYTR